MKLHDLAIDEAAPLVLESFAAITRMATATSWPVIEYSSLSADKPGNIRRIAHHLGFRTPPGSVRRIAAETSVARHREIMERVRAGKVANLIERQNSKRILREDAETLINDRHIQSGKTGRWRQELAPHEQARANREFSAYLDPPTGASG
ncbi:MAG: hypothetical protein LJE68_07470 [Rhodobacter sp.]|nr:hypothetical protein [Rhodobacter sp.]